MPTNTAISLLFGSLGGMTGGLGLYAYLGRGAERRLVKQLITRMFPTMYCALSVFGVGCFGWALGVQLPEPFAAALVKLSLIPLLGGFMMMFWCPKRLLPRWQR